MTLMLLVLRYQWRLKILSVRSYKKPIVPINQSHAKYIQDIPDETTTLDISQKESVLGENVT